MERRLVNALEKIAEETELAQAKGHTHFPKGQLGRGIGMKTIDEFVDRGFVEFNEENELRITEAGSAFLRDM